MLSLCSGDRALSAADQYNRTATMFQHGQLALSQEAAARLADQYRDADAVWPARFRILEAQAAAWRGMNQVVLSILSSELPAFSDVDLRIRRLSLLAAANINLHRNGDAIRYLANA
ncbi:MAG: hypothetical protein WCC27_11730, partial [Acidobacteriaceae bacterium]